MKIEKEQLLEIRGGALSATMLNAIVRGFDLIIDIGRSLGSALRRMHDGNKCTY